MEFHQEGLRLGEVAESANFYDVHNAHFLWLIYPFQLGDWATAMRYLERAEAMARKLPESLHVTLIMGSKGLSNLLKQKVPGDLDLLRASLQAAEAAGSHIYSTFRRYFLGQWHFLHGEFSEALVHFEAALAIAEQPGNSSPAEASKDRGRSPVSIIPDNLGCYAGNSRTLVASLIYARNRAAPGETVLAAYLRDAFPCCTVANGDIQPGINYSRQELPLV